MQQDIISSITVIQGLLSNPARGDNVRSKLASLRKDLEQYVKGLTTKRREAASHLLVFMASNEQRSANPYAIPVRALLYKSTTDNEVKFRDEVKDDQFKPER